MSKSNRGNPTRGELPNVQKPNAAPEDTNEVNERKKQEQKAFIEDVLQAFLSENLKGKILEHFIKEKILIIIVIVFIPIITLLWIGLFFNKEKILIIAIVYMILSMPIILLYLIKILFK